jgi:GTP-sensing pleiotropic transcriptional regulator CodY
MGTYPKAEVLALIARHKELIETSKKTIECSAALVKQTRQLMGYRVDREVTNHKTAASRSTTTKYSETKLWRR